MAVLLTPVLATLVYPLATTLPSQWPSRYPSTAPMMAVPRCWLSQPGRAGSPWNPPAADGGVGSG